MAIAYPANFALLPHGRLGEGVNARPQAGLQLEVRANGDVVDELSAQSSDKKVGETHSFFNQKITMGILYTNVVQGGGHELEDADGMKGLGNCVLTQLGRIKRDAAAIDKTAMDAARRLNKKRSPT